MMYYFILFVALLIELLATSILKVSDGFRIVHLGITSYIFYGLSIYLFSLSITKINLAIADTIWQGLGIILITLISAFYFNETLSTKQLFFICVTIIGVIGTSLS